MYRWVDVRQDLFWHVVDPDHAKLVFLSFGIIVIRLFIRILG